MFSGFALLVILMMKLMPNLPFARALHRALVEGPLRWIEAADRHRLIYTAVLIALMFGGLELLLLLGSTDMLMLLAWDVSLYADALIATWTLSVVALAKVIPRSVASYLRSLRIRPRPRARRRRRDRTDVVANDSDEDGGASGWARAA